MFQKGAFDAVQKDPNFVMRERNTHERKRMLGGGRPLQDAGLEDKLIVFLRHALKTSIH